jgi:O-antigen/teichoic acid export membrane protein
VAERRIRYPLLWLAFMACMFLGAGLVLSPKPGRLGIGLALIAAPLLALGVLSLVYYMRQRRAA